MKGLLPIKPLLQADLLVIGSATRIWSPHASALLDEPAEWLRLADGTRYLGEVLQAAANPIEALRALHTLVEHDLVGEATRGFPPRIAVIGQGRLAQDICRALANHPIRLLLAGAARPDTTPGVRPAWNPGMTPGALVTVGHVEHWSQVSDERCDVAVVAAETCEADRAILHHLRSRQTPHLVVRAHRDTATIGPGWPNREQLCTSCIDLATQDQDQSWGQLVTALCKREADPDTETSLAAAALAVQRLRATPPGALADVVTVLRGGSVDQQRWPHHPECRCRLVSPRTRADHSEPGVRLGGRTDRLAPDTHAAA